jgi:hypothetical protein
MPCQFVGVGSFQQVFFRMSLMQPHRPVLAKPWPMDSLAGGTRCLASFIHRKSNHFIVLRRLALAAERPSQQEKVDSDA